ncbi:hypothetical protein Trydic_g11338 [Trypoxylus dichotomus]
MDRASEERVKKPVTVTNYSKSTNAAHKSDIQIAFFGNIHKIIKCTIPNSLNYATYYTRASCQNVSTRGHLAANLFFLIVAVKFTLQDG